jgi:hypothetical protein
MFNIAAHALVGCGSALASGGRCGPAALSGAVGSFATPLAEEAGFGGGLVITSTAGGLASVAGGGKFANGALTAAFGYLFNQNGGRKQSDQADDPFGMTAAFRSRFEGSAEEDTLMQAFAQIDTGTKPAYQMLAATDIGLPDNRTTF